MSASQRQSGSMGEELTNAGLIALFLLTLVLRATGTVAAFLTGIPQLAASLAAGAGVPFNPGNPAEAVGAPDLNSLAYWVTTVVVLSGLVALPGWGWGAWRRRSHAHEMDPHRLAGIATRHEVTQVASDKALLKRAATLRPSLKDPGPDNVGYRLGTSKGVGVWASVEDSILLVGPPRPARACTSSSPPSSTPPAPWSPPRLGRTISLLPCGPVNVRARSRCLILSTWPKDSRRGCAGHPSADVTTRTALQSLLHAAALDSRKPADLFRWTLDPAAAAEAVAILTNHPDAAGGWADSLGAMIDADPKTRDSIWQGVALALGALADPRVLDAVTPRDNETPFDPETFLRESGTLYLLATGADSGASAALVAAFTEDRIETARRLAARSPGARLDPPLLLALDEIGNLAPLPSLPTLMAEGGGTGITTLPVLQPLAQARDRWSDHHRPHRLAHPTRRRHPQTGSSKPGATSPGRTCREGRVARGGRCT